MKKATVPIIVLLAMTSIGCSVIGSGKYLVLESNQKGAVVYRRDWAMGIVEPTIGRFLPELREDNFSEEISYIAYPIVIDLRVWAVGPLFFPIIPTWWMPLYPQGPNASYKMKIVWHGDINLAQNILVIRRAGETEETGKQEIIYRGTNELICSYLFKERFTDESQLVLTNQGVWGTEPMPLRSERRTCFAPIIGTGSERKNNVR